MPVWKQGFGGDRPHAEMLQSSDVGVIAVAMINRTLPCHSRAGGNPSARWVRGWIPACAGMTLACTKLYDYGYK